MMECEDILKTLREYGAQFPVPTLVAAGGSFIPFTVNHACYFDASVATLHK